jgi:hypothetical protein
MGSGEEAARDAEVAGARKAGNGGRAGGQTIRVVIEPAMASCSVMAVPDVMSILLSTVLTRASSARFASS